MVEPIDSGEVSKQGNQRHQNEVGLGFQGVRVVPYWSFPSKMKVQDQQFLDGLF